MTQPIDPTTYGAEYVKQYDGSEFEPVLVAARRREVLAAISRHPHERLLEIGCGIDPLFQYVPDAEHYLVVEPVPDFAERARALAGERAVEVHTAYLAEVIEAARVFAPDFIVASSLLHEVPDATALLREIRSVCTAETIVHLNVPNMNSFHRLLAVEMGLIDSPFSRSALEERFGRHAQFDRALLEGLLDAEGFTVLARRSWFIKPFTSAQMQRMLETGIIDARVLEGLERMTRHLPDMGCEIGVEMRCH